MASLATIGKAQGVGLALKTVFGQEPSYLYEDNYVQVYYQPDRLKKVQSKIAQMAAAGPSDVRIDFVPMITPIAIKKALPYAVGLLAVGYLVGKMT